VGLLTPVEHLVPGARVVAEGPGRLRAADLVSTLSFSTRDLREDVVARPFRREEEVSTQPLWRRVVLVQDHDRARLKPARNEAQRACGVAQPEVAWSDDPQREAQTLPFDPGDHGRGEPAGGRAHEPGPATGGPLQHGLGVGEVRGEGRRTGQPARPVEPEVVADLVSTGGDLGYQRGVRLGA
jgi:hypothetical protein